MSWETVPQAPVKPFRPVVPVRMSLVAVRGVVKLIVTVQPDLLAQLGWDAGDRFGLQVGREGKVSGWVRIQPLADGALLARIGRSPALLLRLNVPPDMARWTGESEEAEFRVLPAEHALLAKLPWDLSGDPPAEAEAA